MTNMTTASVSPNLKHTSGIPKNDVFISYSRKDKAFVERLHTAFKRLNRDPWIDWSDIQKGEDWWEAIKRGIEAADTFVFVVSPDSVVSSVCRDEIEYAAKNNKRFLPIVWREGFDMQQVHPAISSHNWLFFRETDNFEQAFQELIKAMDTDLDHVRAHTRLLVRALEWQSKGRNQSYLLRGVDLRESEQWQLAGATKEPQPTNLQLDYINASLGSEAAYSRARQKAKWIVVLTTVLVNMVLAIAVGTWYFKRETSKTLQQVQENLVRALDVGIIGIDGDEFAALASAAQTGKATPSIYKVYQRHQDWLYRVNTVIPRAILRTYIRGNDPDVVLWIGDVTRKLGTNQTSFRQPYVVQHQETAIYDGVSRSVVMTPYVDELGRWVSASGPIKNSAGQVVGGLKVYFKEDYVEQVQRQARSTLVIAYIVVFVWLLVLSLIILRVTRPSKE